MAAPKPGSGVQGRYGRTTAAPKPPASPGLTALAGSIAETNFSGVHPSGALGPGNGTALPWDSTAEANVATAQKTHADTNAQIASNRALGLQEFGLDPGYNDWKNNPYSQAAILQHNHEANEAGIMTTAGQALYSGQTGNAQGIEAGRRNQAFQSLQGQENQAKARWEGEERAAQRAEKEAVNSAKEGAIERAVTASKPEVPVPTVVKKTVVVKKGTNKKGGK